MTWFLAGMFTGGTVGFLVAVLCAGASSTVIFECTELSGEKAWFGTAEDAAEWMEGRGLVAVKRWRVLG